MEVLLYLEQLSITLYVLTLSATPLHDCISAKLELSYSMYLFYLCARWPQ